MCKSIWEWGNWGQCGSEFDGDNCYGPHPKLRFLVELSKYVGLWHSGWCFFSLDSPKSYWRFTRRNARRVRRFDFHEFGDLMIWRFDDFELDQKANMTAKRLKIETFISFDTFDSVACTQVFVEWHHCQIYAVTFFYRELGFLLKKLCRESGEVKSVENQIC